MKNLIVFPMLAAFLPAILGKGLSGNNLKDQSQRDRSSGRGGNSKFRCPSGQVWYARRAKCVSRYPKNLNGVRKNPRPDQYKCRPDMCTYGCNQAQNRCNACDYAAGYKLYRGLCIRTYHNPKATSNDYERL